MKKWLCFCICVPFLLLMGCTAVRTYEFYRPVYSGMVVSSSPSTVVNSDGAVTVVSEKIDATKADFTKGDSATLTFLKQEFKIGPLKSIKVETDWTGMKSFVELFLNK